MIGGGTLPMEVTVNVSVLQSPRLGPLTSMISALMIIAVVIKLIVLAVRGGARVNAVKSILSLQISELERQTS